MFWYGEDTIILTHRVVVPKAFNFGFFDLGVANFRCVRLAEISVEMLGAAPAIITSQAEFPLEFLCINFLRMIKISLLTNGTAGRSNDKNLCHIPGEFFNIPW